MNALTKLAIEYQIRWQLKEAVKELKQALQSVEGLVGLFEEINKR